jgi:hypothetical protein
MKNVQSTRLSTRTNSEIDYDRETDPKLQKQEVSDDCHGGVRSFFAYLHAVLPSRVRGELIRQMSSQNQAPLVDWIDCAIRNCLDQMGSEWLQGGHVQLTSHQDLMSERGSGELSTSWLSCANSASSGLDQNVSFRELGLDLPPQWDQTENELSGQSSNWLAQFENDSAGPASIDLGGSSYGIEDHERLLGGSMCP